MYFSAENACPIVLIFQEYCAWLSWLSALNSLCLWESALPWVYIFLLVKGDGIYCEFASDLLDVICS